MLNAFSQLHHLINGFGFTWCENIRKSNNSRLIRRYDLLDFTCRCDGRLIVKLPVQYSFSFTEKEINSRGIDRWNFNWMAALAIGLEECRSIGANHVQMYVNAAQKHTERVDALSGFSNEACEWKWMKMARKTAYSLASHLFITNVIVHVWNGLSQCIFAFYDSS